VHVKINKILGRVGIRKCTGSVPTQLREVGLDGHRNDVVRRTKKYLYQIHFSRKK